MARFLLIFFGIILALALLGQSHAVYEGFNQPWTKLLTAIAYCLLHWFDGDVASNADVLYSVSTQKAVQIKNGCNGLEGMMVVVAAVVAFPSGLRAKVWGILLGSLAVQAVNLVRVMSLYYLNIWNPPLFDWTHLYLWQALIILDAFVFFLLWTRWAAPSPAPAP